jgi:hypothetical protein
MNDEWVAGDEASAVAMAADRFEGFQIATGADAAGGGGVFGEVTVKLNSPGQVAAAVPHFFGFVPDDSVVVLGLSPHGAGGRSSICHGMRVDLGDVERDPARFARWAVERLLDEHAVEAIVLIYPRAGADPLPSLHRRLSVILCTQLRRRGLMPLDSMFVTAGRWWSFLCERGVLSAGRHTDRSGRQRGRRAQHVLGAGRAAEPGRAGREPRAVSDQHGRADARGLYGADRGGGIADRRAVGRGPVQLAGGARALGPGRRGGRQRRGPRLELAGRGGG